MKKRPIAEVEPYKDGRFILLFGGVTNEDDYKDEVGDADKRPVVAKWDSQWEYWCVAYWDGDWRTRYENPTHFLLLEDIP